MKRFKKYLQEVLNTGQQWYVDHYINLDDPETRTTEFSDHLFDENNLPKGGRRLDRDTVVFDVPKEMIGFRTPRMIENHLNELGYDVHDYEKGLAVRKGGKRPISIGKILSQKIEMPSRPYEASHPEWQNYMRLSLRQSNMLDEYNRCDVRAAMRTPLQIMISRSPNKIAEMSTNKPRWSSCLSLGTCPDRDLVDNDFAGMEDLAKDEIPHQYMPGYQAPGKNAHRIEGEIKSGSHIAYLIPAGDHDLRNPFARVLLKPYHSERVDSNISKLSPESQRYGWTWEQIKPEHTILRPATMTYASASLHHDDVSAGFRQGKDTILGTFRNIVGSMMKKHFPTKHHEYFLDPLAYRDRDDVTTIEHGE